MIPQPEKSTKSSQIDHILLKSLSGPQVLPQAVTATNQKSVHLMRALFIAIDMTQSMHIRDIKPSRLGVSLQMIRKLVRIVRDVTPLCKFMVAKVQNQLCKPLTGFTFSENTIIQVIDRLKISDNAGFFSLQNTLSVALDYFDTIPSTYHKELLIIQSSPFTKDYKDIYQTISIFQQSRISINIASLVGWTFVCKKLVDSCNGRYCTIGSQKQFQQFIQEISVNPPYDHSKVIKKLVKMSLGRRQFTTENNKKMCYCHFKNVQEYFICGMCGAVLCEKMPMECAVCMITLVFPSDLYRHKY